MKRIIGFASGIVWLSLALLSQDIIENGKTPDNPHAGRTVELEEVLRITDEGGEFFFSRPYRLRADPQGAVFVQEQEHLYHFDPTGRFVRDYFKKGQGPGELSYVAGFVPTGEHLIACGAMPGKIIRFGYDGQIAVEFSFRSPVRMITLVHFEAGVLYFSGGPSPFEALEKQVPHEVAVPQTIYGLKDGESELEPLRSFPIQAYLIPGQGGGGGMFSLSTLQLSPLGGGTVALSHRPEYLLNTFSLTANRILRSFRREYDRVKPPPPGEVKGGVIIDGKSYTSAPQKFVADVTAIHADGDRIWAVTSTKDKAGSPLIDVYDFEGRWLDSFHLALPRGTTAASLSSDRSALRDGFLYLISQGEGDLVSILKCRLKDPAATSR